MINAVIFDMDGLLVDSEPSWYRARIELAEQHGKIWTETDQLAMAGVHTDVWVGTLYDNITCGRLNVQWRGRSGTGHGWAGANMVFWNCRASNIDCQKPPTANNYCIGCTGKIQGSGHTESRGVPVSPRSLYLRQLEARLGASAVNHVTTPAQRQGTMDQVLKQQLKPKKDTLY